MDGQFDELSKSLAAGVSRREALRKFGSGLAGVVMASMGLARPAAASLYLCCFYDDGTTLCGGNKCPKKTHQGTHLVNSTVFTDCKYCQGSGL